MQVLVERGNSRHPAYEAPDQIRFSRHFNLRYLSDPLVIAGLFDMIRICHVVECWQATPSQELGAGATNARDLASRNSQDMDPGLSIDDNITADATVVSPVLLVNHTQGGEHCKKRVIDNI